MAPTGIPGLGEERAQGAVRQPVGDEVKVVEHDERPSSRPGSIAPQAVQPITAVAPSSFSAQTLARWVTWFETRTCSGPWREM